MLLRVDEVWRTYGSGERSFHALRGVSIKALPGRFIALRGRSGSGKTTLLNCIGGLDTPTKGSVSLAGRQIQQLAERERLALRRREIGFVFQSFALLPGYSAAENVDLMLRLAGYPRNSREQRVQEVLERVGLGGWADHRPGELSGGQQQRVAIARAIAPRPALILADEPTGELDTATGQSVLTLLRHIVDEQQTTVLMATHDLTVDAYADVVYLLEDGQITEVAKA